MILKGKHTRIRAIETEDLEFLRGLLNSPLIESTTMDTHFPVSEIMQKEWYENCDFQSEFRCIIEHMESGTPIGYICLTNIDWKNQCGLVGCKVDVARAGWGEGDISEAVQLCIRFFFEELHLHRLEAEVLSCNLLSIKLLQKNGFVKEGIFRHKIYKHGKWNDVIFLSLVKEVDEWKKN